MSKRQTNLLLASFFAFAFLVKALIPAGFMPQASKTAFVTIEICTTNGLIQKTLDGEEAPSSEHDTPDSSKCPYAPVLTYGADIPPVPLWLPVHSNLPPRGEPALSLIASALPKDWFATAPPFRV